jgi:hypothetical protein
MRSLFGRHELLVMLGLWCCLPVQAQSEYPRRPWGGYPYPASYDAEIAAPDVHRVLFENENVMFIEVANPPGFDVAMHGHPYPSVFARDTGSGPGVAGIPIDETHLDPASPFAGKGWGQGPAPPGLEFPRCTTAPPEAPHKPINHGAVPVHFYRLEFRRLDGDEFRTRWQEWYPWILPSGPAAPQPPPAPLPVSQRPAERPYAHDDDSVLAAPNNYRLLYEDGHVRLLEVVVRPGETTPAHGNPYASVLAFNSQVVAAGEVVTTELDPQSPLNGQGSGQGPAPSVFNMTVPTCATLAPQALHTIRNNSTVPLHYYRIEFKRIDGDDFPSHWRQWYPWMQYMKSLH